jgi:outer membrane protein assembly factor BamB
MASGRGRVLAGGLVALAGILLTGCPAGMFPTGLIHIGDDADEAARAVIQTCDGGFVVAGFVERSAEEDNNAVLMKLGPNGREIWRAEFGDDREDEALAVAKAHDGGFVIAGQFGSISDPDSDGFLIKTNARGKEEWRRLFDSMGHDLVASVEATPDGGYLLGAQYDLLNSAYASILKTDADGNPLWEYEAGEATHVARATVAADGGYVLAWWQIVPGELLGTLNGRVGILKINADGTEAWHKTHETNYLAEIEDIRATADGGFVLAGQHDVMANDSQALLWKIDAEGEIVWQKTYGRGIRDVAHAVRPTRDGGYVLAGSIMPLFSQSEILLMKTDANGELLWERAFGGDDYDEGFDVIETRMGFVVVGMGESFEEEDELDHSQIVVVKTDSQGRSRNGEVELPEPEL